MTLSELDNLRTWRPGKQQPKLCLRCQNGILSQRGTEKSTPQHGSPKSFTNVAHLTTVKSVTILAYLINLLCRRYNRQITGWGLWTTTWRLHLSHRSSARLAWPVKTGCKHGMVTATVWHARKGKEMRLQTSIWHNTKRFLWLSSGNFFSSVTRERNPFPKIFLTF